MLYYYYLNSTPKNYKAMRLSFIFLFLCSFQWLIAQQKVAVRPPEFQPKGLAVWLIQPSEDCYLVLNNKNWGQLKGNFINEVALPRGENNLSFKYSYNSEVVENKTVSVTNKNQQLLKVYLPKFDAIQSNLESHAIGGMVYVKGGSFQMGCSGQFESNCPENELPVHQVILSDFYICKHEVTQEEWSTVMGSNPSYFKDCSQCPVENVSFHDIEIFLKKLNQSTGIQYRLPTEAEWEFAARGGLKTKGYQYAGSNQLAEVSWYDKNSYKKGIKDPDYGTHPVALKKANELGLYDMSGNVWEWCSDGYAADYYQKSPLKDPKGAKGVPLRILKGGSWHFKADGSRTTFRYSYYPDYKYKFSGFRLAFNP